MKLSYHNNFRQPFNLLEAIIFYIMLLIGFALLLMSTSWFLRTTIDLHTELDLIKTVRTFLAILAILIGVKIHQDKAFSSLLSSSYTVGSALLIYELGILVGLIPLALLTMLSGSSNSKGSLS